MTDERLSPSGPPIAGTPGSVVRSNLADLVARDTAAIPNGCRAWVVSEGVFYTLDTAAPLTVHPTLVIARPTQSQRQSGTVPAPAQLPGRWYRESRAYVVGNFTLWCQAYSLGFVGFTAGQLLASSSAAPDIIINALPFPSSNQRGIVVDNLGNVWLTINRFDAGSSVRKYALKDCLVSGSPAPVVTLETPAAVTEAAFSFFDRNGGLWVPNGTHGTFGKAAFVRYGQRSYSVSGTPQPGITLNVQAALGNTSPATSNQQDSVFDGAGNLWTAVSFVDGTSNGGIFMLSAAQLLASDPGLVPSKFWFGSNFTGAGLGGTTGLAFAPDGKLWCTQYANGAGTLLRAYDVTQPSGNPAPVVTLTCTAFDGPYALAFDLSGNLWVGQGNSDKLVRLPAASLAVSGAVTPDVILTPPPPVPAVSFYLQSNIAFPNNPDKSGPLPSGYPRAA